MPNPAPDRNGEAEHAEGPSSNGTPAPTDPTPKEKAPDPFDPEALRLTGDALSNRNVKRHHLSLQVRNPDRAWWVRAHPDPAYRLLTGVIELRGDRGSGVFLVAPAFRDELAADPCYRAKLLVLAVNTQKLPFIWGLNLQDDTRKNDWTDTAHAALKMAAEQWGRVAANMGAGAYEVWTATGQLPEPCWPELPFNDILRLAFKGRYIDSGDHFIVRQLRGEGV
jgi:hypothetical protein